MRSTAPSGANFLQLDPGEPPLELRYSLGEVTGDASTSFIDAHKKAGRLVTPVQDM